MPFQLSRVVAVPSNPNKRSRQHPPTTNRASSTTAHRRRIADDSSSDDDDSVLKRPRHTTTTLPSDAIRRLLNETDSEDDAFLETATLNSPTLHKHQHRRPLASTSPLTRVSLEGRVSSSKYYKTKDDDDSSVSVTKGLSYRKKKETTGRSTMHNSPSAENVSSSQSTRRRKQQDVSHDETTFRGREEDDLEQSHGDNDDDSVDTVELTQRLQRYNRKKMNPVDSTTGSGALQSPPTATTRLEEDDSLSLHREDDAASSPLVAPARKERAVAAFSNTEPTATMEFLNNHNGDEDSVDTAELARRLKSAQRRRPAVASPSAPTEIVAVPPQPPRLKDPLAYPSSSSEDEIEIEHNHLLPDDNDDDDSSSADTAELTRRIKQANARRTPASEGKKVDNAKVDDEALHHHEPLAAESIRHQDACSVSSKDTDEDAFCNHPIGGVESDNDSADTEELARRLRLARHRGSSNTQQQQQHLPSQVVVANESVHFRLPSQSDSSSSDDDDDDAEEEEEEEGDHHMESHDHQQDHGVVVASPNNKNWPSSPAAVRRREYEPPVEVLEPDLTHQPPSVSSVVPPSHHQQDHQHQQQTSNNRSIVASSNIARGGGGGGGGAAERNPYLVRPRGGAAAKTGSNPTQSQSNQPHDATGTFHSGESVARHPTNAQHQMQSENEGRRSDFPEEYGDQRNIVQQVQIVDSPDLFEAAFGASPPQRYAPAEAQKPRSAVKNPIQRQRGGQSAAAIPLAARTDNELFDEAFGFSSSKGGDDEGVIYVDSDSDDDGVQPIRHTRRQQRHAYNAGPFASTTTTPPMIHSGLHIGPKSPKFNIMSRAFPKNRTGVASAVVAQRSLTTDDIVDYSDDGDLDETYRPSQKVARRVTEDHAARLRPASIRPARRIASMVGNTTATAIDLEEEEPIIVLPPAVPQQHREQEIVGQSGLVRPWRRNPERPRLRDPTASNPFNAASVAPPRRTNLQQSQLAFGTTALAQQREMLKRQRNDILGGSGAGAGGFAIVDHRRGDEDDDEDNDSTIEQYSAEGRTARPARGGRRSTSRKSASTGRKRSRSTNTSKRASSSKKKSAGGSRRGNWSRRGGRGGRGRGGGRGGNRGGNNNAGGVWGNGDDGGWQVSESFTREDPAMQHIGGVEISF